MKTIEQLRTYKKITQDDRAKARQILEDSKDWEAIIEITARGFRFRHSKIRMVGNIHPLRVAQRAALVQECDTQGIVLYGEKAKEKASETFSLKVVCREEAHGHFCGLCGRPLRNKKYEIHTIVEREVYHTETEKTLYLSPVKEWDEDYMDCGDYAMIGSHCAKRIPQEYKATL